MTVLEKILEVFSAIGAWIAEAVTDLVPMFYAAETGLTFIGTLTVASLAIAVVLLIINLIKDFLRFR